MKKLKLPKSKEDLRWYTPEEVFGKARKTEEYKRAYAEETARLALATRIRAEREKKRMTQTAVARKAAMPQSVIARIESGEHSISVDTLARVAHALGKKITIA